MDKKYFKVTFTAAYVVLVEAENHEQAKKKAKFESDSGDFEIDGIICRELTESEIDSVKAIAHLVVAGES